MKPLAQRVSAMLTGKILTTVAIGRFDYVGRFQPFGWVDVPVDYRQNSAGQWVASVEAIRVPYRHSSPRIVTHAGIYVFDRWYIDELPKEFQCVMTDRDAATFSSEHVIEAPVSEEG